MPGGFSDLGRLLQEGLRRHNLEHGVTARKSLTLWERVAGETVAAATQADAIRDGVLYVYTRSSAWSQELSMLREALMARLNGELGVDVVKEIRFQVRVIEKDAPDVAPAPVRRALSPEERQGVEALRHRLEGEVGDKLAALAAAQLQRAEAQRKCEVCGAPLRDARPRCPFCR